VLALGLLDSLRLADADGLRLTELDGLVLADALALGDELAEGVLAVRRFVEKPDAETATRYVREGYLWNSGNFLFLAQTLLAEYALREAATVAAVKQAVADSIVDLGFVRLDAAAFAKTEKRSIDYAVMEKTTKAAAVPASFDWSDVGSWSAVRDLSPQDEAGNAAEVIVSVRVDTVAPSLTIRTDLIRVCRAMLR